MTVVREYNELITSVESQRDALVIILTASRADGEERLPITEAQKETAANAAKSVLEGVGADVGANSTAFVIPGEELADGQTLTLRVRATLNREPAPDQTL